MNRFALQYYGILLRLLFGIYGVSVWDFLSTVCIYIFLIPKVSKSTFLV